MNDAANGRGQLKTRTEQCIVEIFHKYSQILLGDNDDVFF